MFLLQIVNLNLGIIYIALRAMWQIDFVMI